MRLDDVQIDGALAIIEERDQLRAQVERLRIALGRVKMIAADRTCTPRGLRETVAGIAIGALAIIVVGGRMRRLEADETLSDVLVWGGRQHSHPDALIGMKPAAFCEWLFRLLGAERQDTMADIFQGSGAVSRAWNLYTSQEYSSTSRLSEAQTRLAEQLEVSHLEP